MGVRFVVTPAAVAAVVWSAALAMAAAPTDAPRPAQAVIKVPDLYELVQRLSTENGLDPKLVDAVVRVESGYNPSAVSHKGALGLMQLMPDTARRLEVDNPFDPEQNVQGGIRELDRLIERYSGNLQLALAAYNAGEGAVERHRGIPPFRETRDYVAMVMSLYTGTAYRLSEGRLISPVRLTRDAEGRTVITNTSDTSVRPFALSRLGSAAGTLRGGFGSR
ncbi:MAG TPA: lytic transglycosylase domain-containing protein [Thermoanaerobaculales bacterium]|nr:lytic transglycosylase domain-containing protein [Thermoanaerobaculales bacterium]HQL31206.1 lytic transglycosylase domain-containing protein [Thermoanaerobaculales bacterium]